jgi:hypothetical protein
MSTIQDFPHCEDYLKHDSDPASSERKGTPKHANPEFPPIKEFVQLERAIRHMEDTAPESPTGQMHMKTRSATKEPERTTFEDDPLVILEFDEAHTMTERPSDPESDWTNFSELRRALRYLQTLSLFSLFLSTTGKINQFVPSPQNEFSSRIIRRLLRLFQPFTDLGFDQLSQKVSIDGRLTIDDITSDDFIAHFGRPMYVLSVQTLNTHF